jgi:hypothetical protein
MGIEAPPEATRASMRGEVPEKLTYKNWLNKQSQEILDKIGNKKPMTMKELKAEGIID